MKFTIILTAILFVIEISLSDAGGPKNENGTTEEEANVIEAQSEIEEVIEDINAPDNYEKGKKKNSGKKAAANKSTEDEEAGQQKEEIRVKKMLPKKKGSSRKKSIPVSKSPSKKIPADKAAVIEKQSDKEDKQYVEEVKPQSRTDENPTSSNLQDQLASFNPANLLGSLEILQEVRLETKKLEEMLDKSPIGPVLENLPSLMEKGAPKTWDTVLKLFPDFQSTISSNVGKRAAVAVTARSRENTFLPLCRIKDGNVNECLKAYGQDFIQYAKQGHPKLSIPQLDPYVLPGGEVVSMKTSSGLQVELRNVTIFGLSTTKIIEVRSDPANGVFDIDYVIPKSSCQGQYTAKGSISKSSPLRINGEGDFEISLMELFHAIKIRGDVEDKSDGNKYFHVNSVTVHMKPQKMKLRFDNLFKNNKLMTDYINNLINDDWNRIYTMMQSRMEEERSIHILKIVSDFFRTVPYSELFPDV